MTRMLLPFQSGTASGSCGTVSWQIEHLDTRLIVMWSVPFNFNLHDSYFAVGMIFNRGKFTSSGYWFNQVGKAIKNPVPRSCNALLCMSQGRSYLQYSISK